MKISKNSLSFALKIGVFAVIAAGIIGLAAFYFLSGREVSVFGYTFGESNDGLPVDFYYRNAETLMWESETRFLPYALPIEMTKIVLDELYAGARNTRLVNCIPQFIEPPNVTLTTGDTRSVIIDFNESFHQMTDMQKADLIAGITWTMTQLWFVEGVYISVGNEPLALAYDTPSGQFTRRNVFIDLTIPDAAASPETILLYYPNMSGDILVAEERVINRRSSEAEPLKTIIEELFNGPLMFGLVTAIPKETRLNSINRDNVLCYVDLSADFINRLTNENEARLAVMSIVNTLTERQNVKRVQILIDGVVTASPEGWETFDLMEIFERDENIIHR